MRNLFLFFLLLSLASCLVHKSTSASGEETQWYTIQENNRWGYINAHGDTVIRPRFHFAGPFLEGLAAVREGGYYGYIDRSGSLVIPAIYDYALSFQSGRAQVYVDGKPLIIDPKGKTLFQHDYQELVFMASEGIYVVQSAGKKFGIIDQQGKVLVDTIYRNISPFQDGLAVVTGIKHRTQTGDETHFEIGVIDKQGKILVPFGRFSDISPYSKGLAKASFYRNGDQDSEQVDVWIDRTGKVVIEENYEEWNFAHYDDPFSEGLAVVEIKDNTPDNPDNPSTLGVMNTRGEIIFSDARWATITKFKYGRAFVQDTSLQWYLIDRTGNLLNTQPYRSILTPEAYTLADDAYFFTNGTALVQVDGQDQLIDTNGVVLHQGQQLFYETSLQRSDADYVLWEDPNMDAHESFYYFAFWDDQHGLLIESGNPDLPFPRFSDGLLKVVEDDEIVYLDRLGNAVWRSREITGPAAPLNIDHMLRGQFYASSPPDERYDGFGGWGGAGHNAYQVIPDSLRFNAGQLILNINEEETQSDGQFPYHPVYLANTTSDTLVFSAQDSRLYMQLQAQDKKGHWQDIDYLPSSWCGNSYHYIYLPPGHYWNFQLPVFEGAIKTKLRIRLFNFAEQARPEDRQEMYSAAFDGYVNPAQFWRKQSYTPQSIMDPYWE